MSTFASLDPCPGATWRTQLKALLSRGDTPPSFFYDIQTWRGSNVGDYIQHQLKPYYIAALVFAGLALLTLLILLTWRLVILCQDCVCCCCRCKPRKTAEPGVVTHTAAEVHQSRLTKALKVIVLLFALAAMGLTIWGMTQVKKDMVQRGWAAAGTTSTYVRGLADRAERLGNNVSLATPYLQGAKNFTDRAQQIILDQPDAVQVDRQRAVEVLASLGNVLQSIAGEVDGLANNIRQGANDARTQVADQIDQAQRDYWDPSVKGGEFYYYFVMVLLGVGLGILLMVIVFGFFNKRCLLSTFLFLTCIWTLLYFLGAFMAVLLVGSANDGCPAMEPVVLYNVGPKWKPMATYYLTPDSGGLTLVKALNDSQLVDVATINKTMNAAVLAIGTAQSSLGPEVAPLNELLSGVSGVVLGIQGAQDDLLALADVSQARPVYYTVKGYACCVVTDQIGKLYVALTAAGWIMMVMSWIAFGLLGRLDKADMLPRSAAPDYDVAELPPSTQFTSKYGPLDIEANRDQGAAYPTAQHGATADVWQSYGTLQYSAVTPPIKG